MDTVRASLSVLVISSLWSAPLRAAEAGQSPDPVIFPHRTFFVSDSGDYVAVSGRLFGPGLAYNNLREVDCIKARGECYSWMVMQVGPNQVDPEIAGMDFFTVDAWTDQGVSATDDSLCYRTELSINTKTQQVTWIEMPMNNGGQAQCAGTDQQTYVWTIEESLFWSKH